MLQINNKWYSFFKKNFYLLAIAAFLFFASIIIGKYKNSIYETQKIVLQLNQYIKKYDDDFKALFKENDAIQKIVLNRYNENTLQSITDKNYFLFEYNIDSNKNILLNFWSTTTILPNDSIINSKDNNGFAKLKNGYYVWQKEVRSNQIFISLLPIKWNYVVTNTYLQNNFVLNDEWANDYDISLEQCTNCSSISVNNNFLFSINNISSSNKLNSFSIWCVLLAFLIILFLIHQTSVFIAKNFSVYPAILFLAISVFTIRCISYLMPTMLHLRYFELFNPAIYGTNLVLQSLGDLLINVILFIWIIYFCIYQIQKNKLTLAENKFKLFHFLLCLILVGFTFLTVNILRSLVADSQISFEVVNFFGLNIYSLIGFVVCCFMAIAYFLVSYLLFYYLQKTLIENKWKIYGSIILICLLTIFFIFPNSIYFSIFVTAWLIFYLIFLQKLNIHLFESQISTSKLIYTLVLFTLSISAVVILENRNKEINRRKHYAEILANQADPANELLMGTLLSDFTNQLFYKNFEKLKSPITNPVFKDSILKTNFLGYANTEDLQIYTFDKIGNPLYNKDTASLLFLNNYINKEAKPTNIIDLYYANQSFDRYHYFYKKSISDSLNNLIGYCIISASLKKIKTNAINLQLFAKGHSNEMPNMSMYSYAIYENLHLMNSYNDYPFALEIENKNKQEYEIINIKKFNELWYRPNSNTLIIIVKQNNNWIEFITLFSYLFCIFLLFIVFFAFIIKMLSPSFFKNNKMLIRSLSIKNQIHSTIIFICIISFIVIGVATISFFIDRYNVSNKNNLSKMLQVMQTEVGIALQQSNSKSKYTSISNEFNLSEKSIIDIKSISKLHEVDVNIFNLKGGLKLSTLSLPYNKGIINDKIDPIAFYHLYNKNEIEFSKEEHIGKLNFISEYIPLLDDKGKVYAFLNIPYFTSQENLKQEISNFLVAIINLNAFIFLIAGIIAFFITNRITQSFSIISNKMQDVHLGKTNEKIIWNKNDEIGSLVKEYNKMLDKLDESAKALAQSEREGAWSEMAKQVAHEIKNPLTPMKLSLQYLQQAIVNQSPNVNTLANSMTTTLIEQINHLNKIADDFSQFANINTPKNEIFDVNEMLSSLTLLHTSGNNLNISLLNIKNNHALILADKTQMNRVFTNLLKNAIESVPNTKVVEMEIEEMVINNQITISIKDNGSGISKELEEKIFVPNFTTKNSGTGLGLAISKRIVEQANGSIWFESNKIGTTFYVQLPLYNQ